MVSAMEWLMAWRRVLALIVTSDLPVVDRVRDCMLAFVGSIIVRILGCSVSLAYRIMTSSWLASMLDGSWNNTLESGWVQIDWRIAKIEPMRQNASFWDSQTIPFPVIILSTSFGWKRTIRSSGTQPPLSSSGKKTQKWSVGYPLSIWGSTAVCWPECWGWCDVCIQAGQMG